MSGVFSEREDKIIRVLGDKKLTARQICDKVFKSEPRPFDAEISINNTVRRIIEKCTYHKLDWTLNRDKENGKFLIYRKEN